MKDELGRTGLKIFNGRFNEEFLKELQGLRGVQIYREMSDNDEIIGSLLFSIKMLCRQAKWSVQSGGGNKIDIEAAEFVESCLHDMQMTWSDTVSEILSFLTFGWSLHEIVYKRRLGRKKDPRLDSKYSDGLIGWQKLPVRSQETLYQWEYDERDNLTAFIQMPAPDYKIIRIPAEKFLLFRAESRKDNPEGRSILRNAYRCFDETTEILTRNGWKFGIDLLESDELATLNPSTKQLEYEKPHALHKYFHEGKMYRATSEFLDLSVTEGHRLWVKRDQATDFGFIEAQNLNPNCSFMRFADWQGQDKPTYFINEVEIAMDDWAAFLALYLAAGCAKGQKIIAVSQKETRAPAVRALLNRLPYHYYEHKGSNDVINFEFYDAQLYDELSGLKFIPEYIKELCPRRLKIFLDWFGAGEPIIFTTSKRLSDDLQEIILKAGYESQISTDSIGVCERRLHKPEKIFTEEYQGLVWCPSTKNGIVYVRRNGKACWAGNCWFFKKRIQEIEGIGIERDLAGFPVLIAPEGLNIWSEQNAALYQRCLDFVSNIRRDAMEGLVIPYGWELKLLSTGGSRQFDTSKTIERYDSRIAMTVLADFLMLGHEQTGSWALSSDKTRLFAMAIGVYLNIIAEVFNRKAIPALIDLNPKFKGAAYPELTPGDIETQNLTELGEYLKSLAELGLISPDEALEDYLREQASLPPRIDSAE